MEEGKEYKVIVAGQESIKSIEDVINSNNINLKRTQLHLARKNLLAYEITAALDVEKYLDELMEDWKPLVRIAGPEGSELAKHAAADLRAMIAAHEEGIQKKDHNAATILLSLIGGALLMELKHYLSPSDPPYQGKRKRKGKHKDRSERTKSQRRSGRDSK